MEWYPAIMDEIDKASEVVCLLTQHGVDKPWLLYESGVPKGTLDKDEIGIALGISFSSAITWLFSSFQNHSGDEESINKLVPELVMKGSGLDFN